MPPFSSALKIPDRWQQDALLALRAGRDVIVQAPTGAGKTHVFEMLVRSGWRKRAVYTVPTRALANDKREEWRAQGLNVGIATGDIAENLDAPILVATLETQRGRFLRPQGNPGQLREGMPLEYGAGAAEMLRECETHAAHVQHLLDDRLNRGNLERVRLEWHSLLNHLAHAHAFPWERWRALQSAARRKLDQLP